ncbi:hypothetical protein ACMXYX_17845 (plasmid) [Neptuniibacter sp. QD72_48]|uniref:hypothetical protein n=1 Tax=Neptuniibacter sp. QD72_48 TaxID=3398214 RepID=UPI0039F548AF
MAKKKVKKLAYRLYHSHETVGIDTNRVLGASAKEYSDTALFKLMMDEALSAPITSEQCLYNHIDFPIFAEEHRWKRHKRPIIFPANEELLKKLITAKFDMSEMDAFDPPMHSFMLAMPKGFMVEGVEMTGLLVNWFPYRSEEEEIYKPFTEHYGHELGVDINHPEKAVDKAWCLSIMQLDRLNTKVKKDATQPMGIDQPKTIRTMITTNYLKSIMQAENLADFGERLQQADRQTYSFMQLDKTDMTMQFYAFKIITALFAYNSATDGKYLKSGLPSRQLPTMLGNYDGQKMRQFTLSGSSAMLSSASRGEHYRSWHFRNLRDERYYKGEHANKPRGSRWVFVSDSLVGGSEEVDPYTQE